MSDPNLAVANDSYRQDAGSNVYRPSWTSRNGKAVIVWDSKTNLFVMQIKGFVQAYPNIVAFVDLIGAPSGFYVLKCH